MKGSSLGRGRALPRLAGAVAGVSLLTAVAVAVPASAGSSAAPAPQASTDLWELVPGNPPAVQGGAEANVRPEEFRAYRLDVEGIEEALDDAPRESLRAEPARRLVLSIPAPGGGFQRFAVEESPVMEPGLAAKHPEIKTYAGRGIDDPTATIRADVTPLGFHASVRSPDGFWYVDPYYERDRGIYVTYYGRDLEDPHGEFDAREPVGELAEEIEAGLAALDVPEGPLVTLRTYRLALLTNPGYASYFGAENVTAAKVTLINRVNQVYEDETAIRLVLVANSDLINLNTAAQMTEPNGPCGAAPCYTPAQSTSCSGGTLSRTRIVIGQLIGASNFDIGHIALGNPGGGVASLGVVGANNKAQGCTGLSTPVGDFFAVDYVAHEMGHQFAGNHTFNGTQSNCSGGNRSAANSVEPGSGSSIMAYAGICQQDNLQPHSDPYWSQRSFQEITTFVNASLNPINEVQNVSLQDFSGGDEIQSVALSGFGGTDSFQLSYEGNLSGPIVNGTNYNAAGIQAAIEGIAGWPAGATVTITSVGGTGAPTTAGFDVRFGGTLAATNVSMLGFENPVGVTAVVTEPFQGGPTFDSFTLDYAGTDSVPIVKGSNYTTAGIQQALQGVSEVQTVTLDGYDADGDSFRLAYQGSDSVPIVRGQNNTTAGIQAALQGGNEQQQVVLTGFNGASQSFRVELGGELSAVLGAGGLAISNANVAAAVNAIPGFAGTVSSSGAGNGGFTLTFSGASAATDVPSISIVDCTAPCAATVRETVKGGGPVAGWPASGSVAVGSLSDAGFTLTFGGTHQGTNVSLLAVTDGSGASGSVAETTAGTPGILPVGATATVAAFGATGSLNDFGFQVTFGGTLGLVDVSQLALTNLNGVTGFVGETARGGPVNNFGHVVTVTDNHAPVVDPPGDYSIPVRTPFALTGSATDFDGDTLTYMWEQNDRGGISGGSTAGTALVSNTKTNGPLFRQFGRAADVSATDTLLYHSPGLNAVSTDPTRVFPDMAQILANQTNAVTGTCPAAPPAPTALPFDVRECFSEFLPTADWIGFLGDRTMNFRVTVRDGNPGAGGVANADARLTLVPTAGPFLVTSHGSPATLTGGSAQTVTWDVAGTDLAPIGTTEVSIGLSVDGGLTYPYTLAGATANDGSETVTLPNVAAEKARIRVAAVGNVFFDLSDADVSIRAVPVVTTTDPTVQYSDSIAPATVVSATDDDSAGSSLSAEAVGLPAGLSLAVGSTSDDAARPGSRTWTVAGDVTSAPGTYPVTVTVTDESGEVGTGAFTITVAPEDASAAFVGDTLAFAGPGGSAAVVLRATVRDSAVVPGSGDSAPGDVRKATVTFTAGGSTLCGGPLAVSSLNGSTTTGIATCTAVLGTGAHDVDVVVGDHYTGSTAVRVEVLGPADARAAARNGRLLVGTSAGTHAADAGSALNFDVDVKVASGEPRALVGMAFESGGRTYELAGETLESLGTALGAADLRVTVDLYDRTKRRTLVASGLSLHVTMTDRGAGGTDTIGFTLWHGDTLVLSSSWTGARTLEQTFAKGDATVR